MEEETVQCKKCGNHLPKNSKYCPECGKKNTKDNDSNASNTDKKIALKWTLIVIVAIILMYGIGQIVSLFFPNVDKNTAPTMSEVNSVYLPTRKPNPFKETSAEKTEEELVDTILYNLQEIFGIEEVKYDKQIKQYDVSSSPNNVDVILGVMAEKYDQADLGYEYMDWGITREFVLSYSKLLLEYDTGYKIRILLGDENRTILLLAKDGRIVYDYSDE